MRFTHLPYYIYLYVTVCSLSIAVTGVRPAARD